MLELQWDDLRVFLALLRAPNQKQAASQLGVDRSTISRRLSALEKILGQRLFARSREGLRPAAAAQRLRTHAEKIEADISALRSAASVGVQPAAGNVRIATTEGLAAFLVDHGLLSLVDSYPDLRLEILAGNKPLDVGRGEADLALRLSPLKQAALRVRCVCRYGVGLFASPDYLQARGIPRSRSGLSGHDILLPTGELSRLPESRWLAARKRVRVVFRSNSMPALVAAAVAGRGIVAIGLGWGDANPGLERILVLDNLPARPIWLVTRESEGKRPSIRLVADRIASIFARAQAPRRQYNS